MNYLFGLTKGHKSDKFDLSHDKRFIIPVVRAFVLILIHYFKQSQFYEFVFLFCEEMTVRTIRCGFLLLLLVTELLTNMSGRVSDLT